MNTTCMECPSVLACKVGGVCLRHLRTLPEEWSTDDEALFVVMADRKTRFYARKQQERMAPLVRVASELVYEMQQRTDTIQALADTMADNADALLAALNHYRGAR